MTQAQLLALQLLYTRRPLLLLHAQIMTHGSCIPDGWLCGGHRHSMRRRRGQEEGWRLMRMLRHRHGCRMMCVEECRVDLKKGPG